MIRDIPPNWRSALNVNDDGVKWRNAINDINAFLQNEDRNQLEYYPNRRDIFAAFRAASFDRVRVVIIGQDPYPDENKAKGLAFFAGGNRSDSLDSIYTAMGRDGMRGANLTNACLKRWAEEEYVLLLNSVLTIRKVGDKNMHNHKGWERFIGAVLRALSKKENPIHFMLWGSKAQKFKPHIKGKCYHIHAAPHPSPRNNVDNNNAFLNCRHFSAVNNALGDNPINWLPPQED